MKITVVCDLFKVSLLDDTGLEERPMIMMRIFKLNLDHDQFTPRISLFHQAAKVI